MRCVYMWIVMCMCRLWVSAREWKCAEDEVRPLAFSGKRPIVLNHRIADSTHSQMPKQRQLPTNPTTPQHSIATHRFRHTATALRYI